MSGAHFEIKMKFSSDLKSGKKFWSMELDYYFKIMNILGISKTTKDLVESYLKSLEMKNGFMVFQSNANLRLGELIEKVSNEQGFKK